MALSAYHHQYHVGSIAERNVSSTQPNTVGACKNITPIILHYISSRLVTLLKVTVALIQALIFFILLLISCGPGSSVGIAADYGLNGPGSNQMDKEGYSKDAAQDSGENPQ